MSNNTNPDHDPWISLRVPEFRRFLSMRLTTTLAIQIMSISVGYFVYDITGSPLKLGLIGLVEAIPAIGVSLWAGHLADKYNRRNIAMACIALLACCAGFLLSLTLFQDALPPSLVLPGLYTAVFFTGLARGFFSPANFAFLPQLVDRKTLPNAIVWNSSTWQVASVSGLGIGGLIYGFYGVEAAFGTMTALLLLALVLIASITPHPVPPSDTNEPALVRIREGLRFVLHDQRIIGAIALDMFAVLFGGAVALLPVYAKDILKIGPEGLGVLRAAMSLGAIAMAFVLAHRPPGRHAGRVMLACVGGFGLCMIGFGLSTVWWLSFAFLFVAGMLDEVSVFIRSSLIQRLTPEHMKGRVSSVSQIFVTSSNELGAFESGLAASLFGTVPAVLLGGSITLLVVGAAWVKAPRLRDLDFSTLD